MNDMTKNPIVVALDIGTTKICVVAGRKSEYGKLEVLSTAKVESLGVLRGVVSNIEKTVNAISEAVNSVQRAVKEDITHVHVGIAGQHIKSLQHRGILTRDSNHTEISEYDIQRLIKDMHKLVLPPGDKILHVIPQEYTVDNEQGITDPIGMSGVRLEANFHIITGQITASNNLYRCVERAGLQVSSMTLEPIASATAVLNEEEKEAGVALVDIGGGTTDITIFQDGIIRHTAVIPFGGNIVTQDIKQGCRVMEQQAEKLKVKFGNALAEKVYDNRIITIPGLRGREPKEISEKNLARVIQARMEEILDHVHFEIKRSGFENKLIGGIVLTGGGALLKDIEKLAAYQAAMPTRIGIPIEHLAHGYMEEICSPMYATAIGLLLKAVEDIEQGRIKVPTAIKKEPETEQVKEEEEASNGKWYENVFQKTKEWFEAEPDREF
ncbi:MAG: cell division protein FtsA [Bacteroidota bacterium]